MGTKSREVLTASELQDAFNSGFHSGGGHHFALRAVEQAVLAKLHDDESPVNGHWECFSPAEARELERKAWDAAAAFCWGSNSHVLWNVQNIERDRRYPSLTPPKPKSVTLSDGKVWRITDKGWKYLDQKKTPLMQSIMHELSFDAPLCRTPEDFEAVARYLRDREAK